MCSSMLCSSSSTCLLMVSNFPVAASCAQTSWSMASSPSGVSYASCALSAQRRVNQWWLGPSTKTRDTRGAAACSAA